MLNKSAEFYLVSAPDLIETLGSPGGKPYVTLMLEDGRTVNITLNLLAQLGAQARHIIDTKRLE